ncbi:MAG: glycosyltransferase family 39 protein [Candidatus Omnitrophota bacterium]
MSLKFRSYLILSVIFCFHLGMNFYVLQKSQIAHAYDESGRIATGYNLFKAMGRIDVFIDKLLELDWGQAHPRLYEAVEAVSWKIWQWVGKEDVILTILLTNAIFLFILLFSVYGIGRVLYDDTTALLAAFLTSIFPLVVGHSRIAMLDFPLMSMVSLGFFLLLKTRQFSSVAYSALCGVFFALAELIKETAIFFMAAPLVYYLFQSFRNSPCKHRVIVNSFVMLACFFPLVSMVYLRPENFHAYAIYTIKTAIRSSKGLWHYWVEFPHLIGPVVAIFSVPFFVRYFIYWQKRNLFVLCWWFVPFLLFSFSNNKTLRFVMPVAPAFALILAYELRSLKGQVYRGIMTALLVCLALAQYATYYFGFWPRRDLHLCERGVLAPQRDSQVPVAAALTEVFRKEKGPFSGRPVGRVVALFNQGTIHDELGLQFTLKELPFYVVSPMAWDDAILALENKNAFPAAVLQYDFVLDMKKDDDERMSYPWHVNYLSQQWIVGFDLYRARFVKIAQVPVDVHWRVDVYRRIK